MNTVRFHPNIQVDEVLSIYDYTPREIAASWYSDEEMERITSRCSKIIRKMDKGRGKKYCIRGFEGVSKLGSITKTRNRSTAKEAVLMEQSQQWLNNTVDEQAIADVYMKTTSSCQMWAQVMGRQDRQAADAVLYEDDDEEEYMVDEMRIAAPTTAALNESKESTLKNEFKERALNVSKERTFPSTLSSSSPRSIARKTPFVVTTTAILCRSPRTPRLVAVS